MQQSSKNENQELKQIQLIVPAEGTIQKKGGLNNHSDETCAFALKEDKQGSQLQLAQYSPVRSKSQLSSNKHLLHRMDKFNTPILKKPSKMHRITFRDQIQPQKQLTDVYPVECWKQYNIPFDDQDTSCSCRIY